MATTEALADTEVPYRALDTEATVASASGDGVGGLYIFSDVTDLTLDSINEWGTAGVYMRAANRNSPYGGLQFTCRYHARNKNTGCKRYLSFPDNTLESKISTLWKLRWWANIYGDFNRQRDHIRCDLSVVPHEDVIRAQRPTTWPEHTPNDEDLDAFDAGVDDAPEPEARHVCDHGSSYGVDPEDGSDDSGASHSRGSSYGLDPEFSDLSS